MSGSVVQPSCPYPGLRAFFTDERDWYFGREAHVDAMLTCLESNRFLAIVGSSGAGKSSLVFAGLIPALCEGQLAGSRTDESGAPAPWNVISFHPGNDPLAELAAAILKAARDPGDAHLAGYIRAALDSGDHGLTEALNVAGLLDPRRETLVYADQFEELFRFGEKSDRIAQENALRFAHLFVVAAEQQSVRLHLLLSMRSEFIGECERFPGLPELVSRSQFLTPRVSRKQLGQALGEPATTAGKTVAPDALNALLNDSGNSPDQLPLAQHVLRRMWQRAERASRAELTLDDYEQCGGIRNSIAKHGDEILATLPQPDGPEVARILFMALCDQREEGPLVRRLSTRAEVEGLAGEYGVPVALVAPVIAAFAGDDPGFIREDQGWLDVRHEAVLRQWPLISTWRSREADSEKCLHELSDAAHYGLGRFEPQFEAFAACQGGPDLPDFVYEAAVPPENVWQGHSLRRAEGWVRQEKPGASWALRHGVKNWPLCARFLELSREAAQRVQEKEETRLRVEQAEAERRQLRKLRIIIATAVASLVLGFGMFLLWRNADASERRAVQASNDRFMLIGTMVSKTVPVVASGKATVAEAERQSAKLLAAVGESATSAPPEQAASEELARTLTQATDTAEAIGNLAAVIAVAAKQADVAAVQVFAEATAGVQRDAEDGRRRLRALRRNEEARKIFQGAIAARLEVTEKTLAGLLGPAQPAAAEFKKRDADILAATAHLAAISALEKAAAPLGFTPEDFAPLFGPRVAQIAKTIDAARRVEMVNSTAPKIVEWQTVQARELPRKGGTVRRVRFLPSAPRDRPLLAVAGDDVRYGSIVFWFADGMWAGEQMISSAINDIAFSPAGDALAVASNGSTVRVAHWKGSVRDISLNGPAFEAHSDSVTDVEFSRGGELIASASADRTVRVFRADSLKQLYYTSPPLPGIVTSVLFHPKGNLVVSGCDDGGVRLHTIDQPGVVLLGKLGAPARRPEFSENGRFIVAASGDKTARVWGPIGPNDEPKEVLNLEHPAPVTQATFRPVSDGKNYVFITTATNGEVRVVRLNESTAATGKFETKVLEPRHPGAAVSATWSADGLWLATVGGGEVLLWAWVGDAPVARLRLVGLNPGTSRAEFSPDARLVVAYGGDSSAYVWDLSKLAANPAPNVP